MSCRGEAGPLMMIGLPRRRLQDAGPQRRHQRQVASQALWLLHTVIHTVSNYLGFRQTHNSVPASPPLRTGSSGAQPEVKRPHPHHLAVSCEMARPSPTLRDYVLSASETHPAERKLVRKVDFFILTFCCLSYFLNYVIRSQSCADRLALTSAPALRPELTIAQPSARPLQPC